MKNGQVLPIIVGGYECIGSPVLIVDPQTAAILDANESACIFYGYSHTDFIQNKILDLAAIPVEEAWQRIQKISSGEITHMSSQHRVNSGEIRDVEVDLRRGTLGNKLVIIATIHDVTEREQTKKKLEKTEEQYRLLFENMREGFSLYELIFDNDGKATDARILAANDAYELHTGLKPIDVVGKTIMEVMPQTTLSQLESYFKVALTGEPISQEYFSSLFQRYFRTQTFCPQPGQFATIVEDITERRQTEVALQESEARLSTIFHSSHDSISIHGLADNIFLDVNEAFSAIFGLTREQIIGHTGREFYTPLDPAEREEMMLSLRSQGQFTDIEARFHNRQGQVGHLLLSGKIINVSGKECVLLFGKDITLRKQAEAALQAVNTELEKRVQERTVELRRSLERLGLATSAANMGIWDWDIQKDELVWDQQMYTLYGVNPEDFSGAYEAWLGGVNPDDRQHSDEIAQRALRGEIAYDTEFRVLWPDGSTHWLKADGQVFWDEQGKPVRMLGANYDITERKKAVDEIRESEEKFSKAFYESPIARAIARESDGNIENVNTRFIELFEYPLEQVIDHTPFELGLAQRDEDFKKMTQILMNERKDLDNYENVVHLRSGKDLNILISSAFITLNQVKYLLLTFVDVTALKQVQQKLTETNLALEKALHIKDEFMAAMSHELRTPLNGILGVAELLTLTAGKKLSEKEMTNLAIIEQSGQQLLNLVDDFLEFTQLQGGSLQPDIQPLQLAELCTLALQKITPRAAAREQQVHFAMSPEQIETPTDKKLLDKILSLLLDNASKFTSAGGRFGIEVTGRSDAGLVDIVVWDMGIGIAEEDFPRLFKPFTQLDASLARQFEGTGKGLAMVKSMTELLGGQITVQSTIGKGSRFTVTLPWK